MDVKDVMYGIKDFTENVALAPFEELRFLELDNWWFANVMTWLFIAIFFVALFYWLKQLKIFNDNNEEQRDVIAHSFLASDDYLKK